MAAYDFTAPRLFLEADLAEGLAIPLDRAQSNYLLTVLRLGPGGTVLVFNGRDGEWVAEIVPEGRKSAVLALRERVREQTSAGDLLYLFAPLKTGRLDYMAQKAVEMGASALGPVFTRRTQGRHLNRERLRANAVEAAEQCGILTIPDLLPDTDLEGALAALEGDRLLVFCDEEAPIAAPLAALARHARPAPLAILVGPEGGFAGSERERILARPNTLRLSLGPRILRADTAAVAVLALVQATLGDWT